MNTPLPAHLGAGIRHRIACLREASQIDEIYAPRQLAGYPTAGRRHETASPGAAAPTFARPRRNDTRSRS